MTRDDVEHGKPRPDLFIKAARGLEVQPERCLSLEDSHNGIRSAHAAGTMPVMVPDIVRPTDEIRAMCAAVVDDLGRPLAGAATCDGSAAWTRAGLRLRRRPDFTDCWGSGTDRIPRDRCSGSRA